MAKYTEAHGSIPDTRWLKRIANESAETNRLLRRLLGRDGHSTNVTDSDDAGTGT